MKKLLITVTLFMPITAYAQPVPEIILRVTQAELDLISEGLQTQPFGKVVPLINKLREQIIAQSPKPAPLPSPASPVEPKKE